MKTQLDQLKHLEHRIAEAKQDGRALEREFITNVLTATMLDCTDPNQKQGLRLARDIVRGLPPQN